MRFHCCTPFRFGEGDQFSLYIEDKDRPSVFWKNVNGKFFRKLTILFNIRIIQKKLLISSSSDDMLTTIFFLIGLVNKKIVRFQVDFI